MHRRDEPASERADGGAIDRLEWFEALYDAQHRRAFGLACLIVRDVHDAEDVVQEAFLGAWRSGRMPSPTDPGARSWILAIVRNRAIDALRARRKLPRLSFDDQLDGHADLIGSNGSEHDLDRANLQDLLGRLPAEQRQVIELAYLGGLTHREIAARLDLPLGTVKGRIRLALNRLASVLFAYRGSRSA